MQLWPTLIDGMLGPIIPGKTLVQDTTQTIDLDNVALDGGILVKVLDIVLDPYMRISMRDEHVKGFAVRDTSASCRSSHAADTCMIPLPMFIASLQTWATVSTISLAFGAAFSDIHHAPDSLSNYGISKVLRSEHPNYKAGEYVCTIETREFFIYSFYWREPSD